MNELKLAPSTIEVGKKSSVELSPFELKNRSKRKEDFTKTISAIASGNPDAALDYEAVYSLDDDYDKDQEAIQTFLALQSAAMGDKNAAMSLFDKDEDITNAISSLRGSEDSVLNGGGSPIISDLGQGKEESRSPDFSKLSRQGLALGGLPQTAPVNVSYLELLKNKPAEQSISLAAQAGIGTQNTEYFDTAPSADNQSTYSGLETASAVAPDPGQPASRTSAGATLAAIGPNLASNVMGAVSGRGIDPTGTAMGILGSSGKNSNTALSAYGMLGKGSAAINNPNLDLTNISTVSSLANMGISAANTVSKLSNLDLAEIPNEIVGAFDRVGQFVSDFAADPLGTLNSALDTVGMSIAYGDITDPVAVDAVPGQTFSFSEKTLEVVDKPGFLGALFGMMPSPLGLTARVSGMIAERNVGPLSDFSKAKSYQAWDMVAAATEGQMGVSDEDRSVGIESMGVGFSGLMSGTVNTSAGPINVSFDPFAEQPTNTMTSFAAVEHQMNTIDPLEIDMAMQELNAAVQSKSYDIQNNDLAAFDYLGTLTDVMDASFAGLGVETLSEMEANYDRDPAGFVSPYEADIELADYAMSAKTAADAARTGYARGELTSFEAAQQAAAAAALGSKGLVGRNFAQRSLEMMGRPAFGTHGYYTAQREQQLSTALDMASRGDMGPGSFSSIGESIAENYNSQNPSFNTLDAMEKAGLTSVSVNRNNPEFDMLGRAAFDMDYSDVAPDTSIEDDPTESGEGADTGPGDGDVGAPGNEGTDGPEDDGGYGGFW